jgi:hypothetical protein
VVVVHVKRVAGQSPASGHRPCNVTCAPALPIQAHDLERSPACGGGVLDHVITRGKVLNLGNAPAQVVDFNADSLISD